MSARLKCSDFNPFKEHPFIVAVTEGEAAVSLSAEEHKILADYFNLYVEMTNLERQQIYFRGHTDSFAYLKKMGGSPLSDNARENLYTTMCGGDKSGIFNFFSRKPIC